MNAFIHKTSKARIYHAPGLLFVLIPAFLVAETSSSLIERSPFLPPDFGQQEENLRNANLANQPPSQVDFVGYSGYEGNWEVALFFAQSKQVHWMKPGETVESVRLVDFDPERGAIQITERNRSKFISLNADRPPAQNTPPPIQASQNRTPSLPPGINKQANNNAAAANNANSNTRRVIPRRRVILPKK